MESTGGRKFFELMQAELALETL